MRNLKRALSLALASVMLLGMMVVGSSAKGLDDFSDNAEIVNKDAVAVTSAIGLFDGYAIYNNVLLYFFMLPCYNRGWETR